MSIAIYIKKPPEINFQKQKSYDPSKARRRDRIFFALITLFGLSCVLFAAWPFIVWQVYTLPRLSSKVENYPVPMRQVLSAQDMLSANVQVVQNPDGFSYFVTDYQPKEQRPKEFLLTIPKLEIEKAKAKVDDLNFYKNLSHFPGSALPGEIGNSFVTGHSVLPQFYDPKNFKAIFTQLSDLEIGNDIFVEMEGQTLHFSVQYSKVVSPHDTSVLLPISATGRNLTLMTCVPPGTNLKRLVVITSLI